MRFILYYINYIILYYIILHYIWTIGLYYILYYIFDLFLLMCFIEGLFTVGRECCWRSSGAVNIDSRAEYAH